MAFQRKYKFNWLDHLHYMGRSSWRVHTRWPKPLAAVAMSVLWFPLCLLIVFRSASLEAAMSFIACLIVVAFGSEWLLGKYRFTAERERVYFRRYPQRKHYSVKVLFWIPVALYLSTISIWCYIFYNMSTRKITISDGVFYRLWRMVPAGGFPDRCFVIMAMIQSAWIMLPILTIGNLPLCRIFPAISPYYPDRILCPILPLYIALLVYDSRRYNEEHYINLHKTVTDLPLHKWRSLRRRSTTAIWLSTASIIADILLAIRL